MTAGTLAPPKALSLQDGRPPQQIQVSRRWEGDLAGVGRDKG